MTPGWAPLWSQALVITHNGTVFDGIFLMNRGVVLRRHYDTLIGEAVLLTSGRASILKNLSATMQRRIGQSFKQTVDHDVWALPEIPQYAIEYAAADVKYLPKIMDIQVQAARDKGMLDALLNEQKLTPIFIEMMFNGLPIDTDAMIDREVREG